MHSILRALFFTLIGMHACVPIIAQCPGCIPDLSCTVSPAFPSICPAQPPAATAGVPYEADITFWMPATFNDPGSGSTVDLEQLTVTGVTGMPFGLALETSDPAGVYFPQQNEFGCARICGTPLIPGTYSVTISILATVSFSGLVIPVPEQFVMLLHVLPGAGGNNSFTFDPSSGCGSVNSTFQALITDPYAPVTYSWDFGNGETSDLFNPPPQTYDEPGNHTISLQTIIGGLVLHELNVTGVNGNWCGDVEEPNIPLVGCTGSPDLYFVLTDAEGQTWTSSTSGNTFQAAWSGLGLLLSVPPYSLSIHDDDDISQDDHLGTYNIAIDGAGTYYFNVAGGTTGSLELSSEPQQIFLDVDTLVVLPLPMVEIEEQAGQLCAVDTSLVGFTWLLDGDTLAGASAECIPAMPGGYELIAVNSNGCTGISSQYVICPVIEITLSENVLHVPSGYQAYAWSYNGAPVAGADQPFLLAQGDGDYAVTIDAGNDCIIIATLDLAVGVGVLAAEENSLEIFPVPGNNGFLLQASGLLGSRAWVTLHDMAGRILLEQAVPVVEGRSRYILDSEAPAGIYTVVVRDDHAAYSRRLVMN